MGNVRKTTKIAYDKVIQEMNAINMGKIANPILIQGEYSIVFVYQSISRTMYECIVDTEDLPKITSGRSWVVSARYNNKEIRINNGVYAISRFILGYKGRKTVDHINRNTLDNRKANLRIVSISENLLNKGDYKNTKKHRNILEYENYCTLNIFRRFYDIEIAKKAHEEIISILNSYAVKDAKKRNLKVAHKKKSKSA